MPTGAVKYRYVGDHAQEIYVGDKAVMTEPGGFIDLGKADTENPYNEALIKAERLVEITAKDEGGGKNA